MEMLRENKRVAVGEEQTTIPGWSRCAALVTRRYRGQYFNQATLAYVTATNGSYLAERQRGPVFQFGQSLPNNSSNSNNNNNFSSRLVSSATLEATCQPGRADSTLMRMIWKLEMQYPSADWQKLQTATHLHIISQESPPISSSDAHVLQYFLLLISSRLRAWLSSDTYLAPGSAPARQSIVGEVKVVSQVVALRLSH